MTRSHHLSVAFDGGTEGVDELSWGQQEIWAAFERERRSLAFGGVITLVPGSTVEDTLSVLRFVLGRHEALRTRYRCDPTGRPRQQMVEPAGETTLEIVDLDAAEDPATVAAEVADRYRVQPYDYARDWPLRMALIRQHGRPTHVAAMYCHLAIDGHGVTALIRDLANLDPATGDALAPVAGLTPLEQVRQQREPPARRTSDQAMAYWERLLRDVPARRFTRTPGGPTGPRYREYTFVSPALHLALHAYTARTGVDSSTILLAAQAIALARVGGANPSVIREVVSNRFRPRLAESVSVINQTGLCVIDVADTTVDDIVARAWRASAGARKHAYYDPGQLRDLVARLSRDRGEPLDLSCFFNDRRIDRTAGPAEQAPTHAEVRDALPRTTLTFDAQDAHPAESAFLHIEPAADTVRLALCSDSHQVSEEDQPALLREIEAIVVRAAFDPDCPTGVRSTRPAAADAAAGRA